MSFNKLALAAVALLAVVCYANAEEAFELQGELFQSAVLSDNGVATQQRSLLQTVAAAPVYPPVCFNAKTSAANTYLITSTSKSSWGATRDEYVVALMATYKAYGYPTMKPAIYGAPGQRRTLPKGSNTRWTMAVVVPLPACKKNKEGLRGALRNKLKKFKSATITRTQLSWFY